jgi:hypothetical protein
MFADNRLWPLLIPRAPGVCRSRTDAAKRFAGYRRSEGVLSNCVPVVRYRLILIARRNARTEALELLTR